MLLEKKQKTFFTHIEHLILGTQSQTFYFCNKTKKKRKKERIMNAVIKA